MIRAIIASAIVHLTILGLAHFGVGPSLEWLGGVISLGWYSILLFLLMLLAFLLWLLFGTAALAGMGATTAAALVVAGVVMLGLMERAPAQAQARTTEVRRPPKPIDVAVVDEPEARRALPRPTNKTPDANDAVPQAVANRRVEHIPQMFSAALGSQENEGINKDGATVKGKLWTVTLPTVRPSAAEEIAEDGLTRQRLKAGPATTTRDTRPPAEPSNKQLPRPEQAAARLLQIASQEPALDRATPVSVSPDAEMQAQTTREAVGGVRATAATDQRTAVAAQMASLSSRAQDLTIERKTEQEAAKSGRNTPAKPIVPDSPGTAAPQQASVNGVDAIFDRLGKAMPRLAEMQTHLKSQPSIQRMVRQESGVVPVPPRAAAEGSHRDGVLARFASRAEEGFAHAQFNFAEALLQRRGDSVARKRAIAMLERAALSGYVPAQLMLAVIEGEDGVSHRRDIAKAHAWLAAAASQGNQAAMRAREELAREFRSGDAVKSMIASARLKSVMAKVAPLATSGSGGDRAELNEQLRHAAVLGDSETVHVLLARNADADDADHDGRTPLIEAAWRGYPGIVDALAQAGAKLDSRDATGKDAVAWAAINGHARVIARLVAAGSPVNTADDEGFTPLMRAAWNGHADAVAALIAAGADAGLRNRLGRSALDYAREQRNAAVIGAFGKTRTR